MQFSSYSYQKVIILRSKEWFYGKCVEIVRDTQDLKGIAWRALELGVEGVDGTRGHMNHSIGVAQSFLKDRPNILDELNELQLEAIDMALADNEDLRLEFVDWIGNKAGAFGQVGAHIFGYNFDTFKSVATPRLGGHRADGGGGNNEFHIALRLVAHFME